MLSDETIVQQALKGEQAAYGILVHRYQSMVYSLVFRMVKKREEAEEVAQDCFLRAFRYLPSFRGDSKFSTWLYRIAYTQALNHLRKNNPAMLSLDDDEKPVPIEAATFENAQKHLEQNEENQVIQGAIQSLSATDAAIISLFYLDELSLEEICKTMNLSMTNAKTKLCRARQRLKPVLETAFGENENTKIA